MQKECEIDSKPESFNQQNDEQSKGNMVHSFLVAAEGNRIAFAVVFLAVFKCLLWFSEKWTTFNNLKQDTMI
jgi:hypothetical protein